MGWRVDPQGLGVIFARDIPPFAQRHLRPAMDAMLARQGIKAEDVDRFICHPGGMKVIEALEGAFGLGQGTLDHEREVLADHGNMSSPAETGMAEGHPTTTEVRVDLENCVAGHV